jgi:transcription elongation factor GreA
VRITRAAGIFARDGWLDVIVEPLSNSYVSFPRSPTAMTATMSDDARADALNNRLSQLYVERQQLLSEIAPTGFGDDADRATNVDGHVRLAMLEERIVALETELAAPRRARRDNDDGTVAVGDVVTVDLGDGPETYLLGAVDEAVTGHDVITPASPLGRVLDGARIGDTLSYSPRPGRTLQATVLAVA